jgi:hypothetical protein
LILGGMLFLTVSAVSLKAQQDGRMEAVQPNPAEGTTLGKMRSGEIACDKTHAPLLEKTARYQIYRLTWPENQNRSVEGANTTAGQSINDLFRDFERSLPDYRVAQRKDPEKARNQKKFVEEYTHQAVP